MLLTALATSGCTTQIHSDYPQYLANNQGAANFPNVAKPVEYYLDPTTDNHSVPISSIMAGVGSRWIVKFGRVLDATMKSGEIEATFDSVHKTGTRKDVIGLLVVFSLQDYQFSGFEATAALTISAYTDGREILSKDYSATGISQGAKMFWGGGFAMKNAIQQSTKNAIDIILAAFIADLNGALATQT